MRRIYPLLVGRTFDEVADALRESELELAEVVSCTFPGRPEPRSARWETAHGAQILRYEYLPDIELRFLAVDDPDFSFYADATDDIGLDAFMQTQLGPWLESWDALRGDLSAGEHAPANRAAAAFSAATKARDTTVDGHQELLSAIGAASGRGRVAAAEQIIAVIRPDARARIEAAYENADDVELRVHLKRARDRIDRLTL